MALDTVAIEQESRRLHIFSLSFAERPHQFLEFCAPLDLEENLVVAIRYFDVQMLSATSGGHISVAIG